MRRPHDISNESLGGGVLRAPRQEFCTDLVAGTQSRQKYPRLVFCASQQKKNNAVIICRRLQIEHRPRTRAAKFATTSLDSTATTQLLVVPSSSTDIIFGSRQSAGAVSIPIVGWSRQSNVIQITGRDIGRGCLELVVFVIVLDARSAED